ncbi:RNA-binding protein MRN1 [Mycena venus]|uniref:RNA-binding protein MRN1 n=1 Tax=Mycena venus TaxID=2733690 RepID=A0A8H7CBH1_9AGAR|nr:RNA-binding protein MRN1 [Mycena venus]
MLGSSFVDTFGVAPSLLFPRIRRPVIIQARGGNAWRGDPKPTIPQNEHTRTTPWDNRESRGSHGTIKTPRDGPETQGPRFETPQAVSATLRTALGLTVCINNVPAHALVEEVLDIVMAGPIFRVENIVLNNMRSVALTFFHTGDARAFHEDFTSHEVILFGHKLNLTWARGTSPKWNPHLSRSVVIYDEGRLGTDEDISSYLRPFGPIERVTLMKEKGGNRAFVNFLSAESGCWAVEELRKTGASANFMHDRCYDAAVARTVALRNQSRTVLLRGIPRQTTLSEICDRIRGGALHRISYVPEQGVAFVHFAEHSSAAYFLQHAIYRGIIVHGRRLSPKFYQKSENLPKHLVENLQLGATRCLIIEGIVNPDMLRNDCLQYGNVERVRVTDSLSRVSFSSIQHAIRASRMLPKKLGYEGLKITFAKDPCAAPYPRDMRKAGAVHNQLASLLLPAEVQGSLPDDEPPTSASVSHTFGGSFGPLSA